MIVKDIWDDEEKRPPLYALSRGKLANTYQNRGWRNKKKKQAYNPAVLSLRIYPREILEYAKNIHVQDNLYWRKMDTT